MTKGAIWASLSLLLLLTACSGAGQGSSGGGKVRFNRPIELVVPFGPGGGADQVSRTAASVMSKDLGVEIPVVNTPGGTGSTGITGMLAKPPGDSMATLIQDTLSTVAYGSAAFDLGETQAVCRLQKMPSGIFVKGNGPYKNWEDLAKAAREHPGKIKVATVGQGGVDDVMLAALAKTQGTKFRTVPFSDPGERYQALLSGQVDALYEQFGDVRSNLESGDFKGVLAFANKPIMGLDKPPINDNPTLSSDLKGNLPILDQFRGLIVSSKTDPAKVAALSKSCAKVSKNSKFKKSQEMNFSSKDSYQNSKEFQTYLKSQLNTIAKLQKKYGLNQ